ncbi:serine threonine- kinase pim-1-like protein [Labeo rohita]|uniref:Serine threonine-kinase pim-1-like protein n=1 Tax=Labeo rohita TaxID=84645 RepID=A0A498LSX6_LABRO|nr:serine threonine- kinase pim-1-like protein [Labeo rohita]
MGQRVTKVSPMTVGEVYEQHLSTPPTPSTNRAVHHPHPRDETPVGAGGGGGEEEGGGGGEEGVGLGEEGGGGGREEGEGGGEGEEGGRES